MSYDILVHKDFDKWNLLKKKIENKSSIQSFKEGEVWWCFMGLNIGYESCGKGKHFLRPVLIIKKYNQNTCLVTPLTRSKKLDSVFYLRIGSGSFISLTQIKVIDVRRLDRFYFEIESKILFGIREKVVQINFSDNN